MKNGLNILDKFLFKAQPRERKDNQDYTKETFFSKSRSRSGSKSVKISDQDADLKSTKIFHNLKASNVLNSGSKALP